MRTVNFGKSFLGELQDKRLLARDSISALTVKTSMNKVDPGQTHLLFLNNGKVRFKLFDKAIYCVLDEIESASRIPRGFFKSEVITFPSFIVIVAQ